MKSVNTVVLVGHVTRDAELKSTRDNKNVCTFGLATNRIWKDAKGEQQSLAEFHNLVAWGKLADFCHRYVKKAKPLYVEGYLRTRSWAGTNGERHMRTEIVVDDVILLGQTSSSESDGDDICPASTSIPTDL